MIETIRVALSGLAANKLRSGLTILGLMIGVGSVIVLIAVGTGSSAAVEKQIDALGSNVLLVTSDRRGRAVCAAASSSTDSLTVADASALQNRFTAPDVASSSPVVNAGGVTLTYNGTTYSPSTFVGTTPSYAGRPRLLDRARRVVHRGRGDTRTAACWWSARRSSPSCSTAPTRSATPSRSTAPTSRWSASPTPRARTAPPTRTTSRSRR